MSNEEKSLLLKDLCARLPYGVMCRMSGGGFETIEEDKLTAIGLFQFVEEGLECVPYLRPMSSMTKEERYTYYQRTHDVGRSVDVIDEDDVVQHIDWLNEHHFDYRGLIKKGLALEAPEDMYTD